MAKDWQLTLKFSDSAFPELMETRFSCPIFEKEIRGVRAQYPSGGCISIRWQKSTIALCILALKIKHTRSLGITEAPVLLGTKGSAAHVLANLLYIPKSPCDIFGYTSNGTPVLRRMIQISNGRLESSCMPVQVFIRDGILPNSSSISIFLGKECIEDLNDQARLLALLNSKIEPPMFADNEMLTLAA